MISKDIVIIGTGFSGLGMAMKLTDAGRSDFVLLEKAGDVGGTWRDNTYPGCECDIPSHMYSSSYELNPDWSKSFSTQPEIWDYMLRVTKEHRLRDHITFDTEVTGAAWDDSRRRWTIDTRGGDTYVARILVSGAGALHIPNVPEIAGAETFTGPQFHSAQWRHDVDLTGKKVVVVGTGASAIQFVPIIAEDVAELTVFQRSAPWVMPKADKPIAGWLKAVFRSVPGAQRTYRNAMYWALESRAVGFNGQFATMLKVAEQIVKRYIHKSIDDPAVAAKMVPDYRMGCKRVLQSNTYYQAYNRDNVHLDTDGVARITPHGVIDSAGHEHEADVLIYGTGFHVTDAFEYLHVVGRDGRDLGKQFDEHGIETHLGITVNGFPNLFFMLGPNTGLGHNSVVFMIEQQTKYIVRMLDEMDRRGAVAAEPTEAAQRDFNDTVQKKVTKGIWTQGGCTSWYLDSHGKNRTIWPGFTFMYWWGTRKVEAPAYAWEGAIQ